MKKVYYLGYYETQENRENSGVVLAAVNKMDYIIEAIEKNNIFIEVISPAVKDIGKNYRKITEKSQLKLFRQIPFCKNKILKIINRYFIRFQMYLYILRSIGKGDTLIAYHAVPYAEFLAFARKIKKFKLILELEEIYADVNGKETDRKKENKVIKSADAYIFPTELLNKKINESDKPYCIIYGTYHTEKERNCCFNDDKIHVVYAGTFDVRKGGAAAAVAMAEYLNEKYRVHIIGFGKPSDKEKILSEIERVNKISECKVSFDGCLSGESYINFLQSCDIGLSTQNPDAEFNNTSFPSKILSYMANGLQVVSVSIPAINVSAIDEYMNYYYEQTPQKVAEAIKNVKFDFDSRKVIEILDEKFTKDIKNLLGEEI